jgi:hypothetical protein
MSDRTSYIEAGVRHAWMVRYDTGEVITEFSKSGFITKIAEVEWDRVQEFCAYDIKDTSEEPVPTIIFQFDKDCTPIWFHRSTGYIGEMGYEPDDVALTFIGVETEDYKHYACFDRGSTRVLFEKKEG